jgi:transforming growth factor-beta-induced protein
MRRTLSCTLAGVLALTAAFGLFAAPAGAQGDPTKNIVEIAQSNPDLSTLVTAVTTAKLGDTLSGPGPFTVFAPTNAAFAALPAGTLDTLLANPDQLADILKLHVISGKVDSAAATAAAGTNVETLGGPVAVALKGDKLTVGGATVVTADIQASNGVIHVIDAVITAPADAATAAPTGVDTGNSGLAASDSGPSTPLLLMLGTVAIIGAGFSTVTLRRARQRS